MTTIAQQADGVRGQVKALLARDPSLSATQVAARVMVSPQRVHQILQAEGYTYITRWLAPGESVRVLRAGRRGER